MPVAGARAVERMDVPGAGPVPVPVGEEARPRRRPTVPRRVSPILVGKMTVEMRVMTVAVAVDAAGVAMMPVGAGMDPVRMEMERMGVPVVSVGVPPMAVRPGRRRGVGMGHREESHEGSEREPRDRIASASVPVVVPPPRLGGAGDGEHDRESECGTSHRAFSRAGNRRTPRSGSNPHRIRLARIVNPAARQSSPPTGAR